MAAILSTLVAVLGASTRAQADQYDWSIRSATEVDVVAGQMSYTLYNNSVRHSVKYGSREYGINLVWSAATPEANIFFFRESGVGPLTYGETVAIYVNGGGFLRYGKREYGINLVWSATPVYEWRITSYSEFPGSTINPGDSSVALFNKTVGNFVVYGEREYGINLVWPDVIVTTTVN